MLSFYESAALGAAPPSCSGVSYFETPASGDMVMRRFRSMLTLVSTLLIMLGCSSAKEDWNKATAAGTVAAYQDYLNKHPAGEHSSDALNRIHSLQDDAAWAQARQTNTVAA